MSYWSLIRAIGFTLCAAWIAALRIARLLTSGEDTGIGFHVAALFAVSTLAAFAVVRAFPRRFSVDALMFGRIALPGSLALMLFARRSRRSADYRRRACAGHGCTRVRGDPRR